MESSLGVKPSLISGKLVGKYGFDAICRRAVETHVKEALVKIKRRQFTVNVSCLRLFKLSGLQGN